MRVLIVGAGIGGLCPWPARRRACLGGAGKRLTRLETRTATGRLISALDAERIEARLGTPAVVIPRGPLLARLAQDLPEGAVRCGTRFTRLHECGSQVRVWTQYDAVHTTVPRPVHAAADL